MTHTLLLDTSSLAYRAFFALPTSIKAPSGQPVNAVRGVLDMHARLVADRAPDQVIHVFDADWRPADRVAAFDGYKADRPEEPADLSVQFDLLREALTVLGLPSVEAPRWEADDAIGCLVAQAGAGDQVDIVTGDRDLLQLVADPAGGRAAVRILYTIKGVSNLKVFDEMQVAADYGVAPPQYVDFAILRGDPSDGLPGVAGVGEKTAQKLIAKYGSLDALLADAGAQTPRLAQNLQDAGAYINAMQQVVPVRTDVELVWSRPAGSPAAADDLASAWNLEGSVNRLREALGA